MNISSLCVFCGSSCGLQPEYSYAAVELGKLIAEREIRLIYGGASVGLMTILADTVLKHGGYVTGIMPQRLVDREVAHENLTEMLIVADMQERKAQMAEMSDGFISLPGGYGTFDELFEMLSWNQLNLIRKPVGILNVNDYFNPLISQLDRAVSERFLRQEHRDLLLTHQDPAILLEMMENFRPVEAEKWIDRLKEGKI